MQATTVTPIDPAFERHRPLLFAIAYRMLGSVSDAEDIIQEAWLRWQGAATAEIRSPKAFLSTVVTRLCLDQLKSARMQREQYIGPWLPEPLITASAGDTGDPEARLDMADSVAMAFLVLLEQMTPVERAVLLLHDVFDYSYREVGNIVGKSEAACRQIHHRAKAQLRSHRPRFQATPADQHRLLTGFLHAANSGDIDGLTTILAEDVTMWTDGGGKVAAALRPVHGARSVAKFTVGVARKLSATPTITFAEVNGSPALLAAWDGALRFVFIFEIADGRIHEIRIVGNPDKLRHIPAGVTVMRQEVSVGSPGCLTASHEGAVRTS